MALPNHAQDCSRKHVHATVLLVARDQLLPRAYLPQDGAKGPDVRLCAARLQPRIDHVRMPLSADQQTIYRDWVCHHRNIADTAMVGLFAWPQRRSATSSALNICPYL